MPYLSNSVAELFQHQLDASRRFADVMFSGVEKIDRIFIEASHRAFIEQMDIAQAISGEDRPQGVASLQSALLSRKAEEGPNYQREIFRIMADIQTELGKSMQDYVGQVSAAIANHATTPLAAAAREEEVDEASPFDGMASLWASAFEQFSSLANRNMEAVRSSYEGASNAAASAAQHMADHVRAAADGAVNAAEDAVDDASYEDAEDETIEASAQNNGYHARQQEKKGRGGSSRRK